MLDTMNHLGPKEIAQISAASIYFVATAPLSAHGSVNLSPKGMRDTLAIVDDATIAYLDLTGSGAETAAHLAENGRITMMWCSFDESPNILRVYGTGRAHRPGSHRFVELLALFGPHLGVRGIVELRVHSVKNSCGFGVPVALGMSEREDLDAWMERKGTEGLLDYQRRKNALSIDGLPSWGDPGITI